jgi:hypothetical protein
MSRLQKLGVMITLFTVLVSSIVGVQYLNIIRAQYIPDRSPLRLSPSRYKKNKHTHQKVRLVNDEYHFKYRFKDHESREWNWEWRYNKRKTTQAVRKFGVPRSIFRSYYPRPDVIAKRRKAIRDGLYKKRGRTVSPDYSAMASSYVQYTKPLYKLALKSLGEKKRSRREQIRLLMKFVQDIPYGVPPREFNQKIISGILPTPQLFIEKWADCDTKVVLLTSILANDPYFRNKILFIHVPRHLFMAIQGVPKPYDKYITYRGKRYILTEAVGPGRFEFGTTGTKRYTSFDRIERFRYRSDLAVNTGAVSSYMKASRSYSSKGVHLVRTKRTKTRMHLYLKSSQNLALLGRLKRNKRPVKGNPIFIQRDQENDNGYHVRIDFNKKGNYKLNLFSKELGASGLYHHALSYSFDSKKRTNKTIGFPTIYGLFGQKEAYLYKPKKGTLESGKEQTFSLKVPDAKKVAVIVNGKWHFLKRKRGGSSIFKGDVSLRGNSATVYAQFGSKYNGLLKYKIR